MRTLQTVPAPLAQRQGPRDGGLKRATEQLLLGVLPILSVPLVLLLAHPLHNFAVDFHSWYWVAGRRVLHGLSPYTLKPWSALHYPAPAALMFVPFALIPHAVGDWVFTLLVLASVPGTLRLLDVRDWRIYGIVMFWQPVIIGYETANVSLLLAFGLAACWRYRDRAPVVGTVLALLVCVKIFPVVIAVWLLATHRVRAVVWMAAAILLFNVIAWGVVGFGQISVFIHVTSAFQRGELQQGYSLIELLQRIGAGQVLAEAIGIAVAAGVIAVGLRQQGEQRDRVLLSACVAGSLLVTPVVESHYLALMIVPLALARPTLSRIWALPIVLLVTPASFPGDWEHVLNLCVFAALAAVSMMARSPAEDLPHAARAAAA